MILCVDFDGTCVTHEYPKVGREIGASYVLPLLYERGIDIIVYSMRCGKEMEDAVQWFTDNGISLFGINNNPEQRIWTTSVKPYAHMYIDDAALGCPLIKNGYSARPFVDWSFVAYSFAKLGYIEYEEAADIEKKIHALMNK